MARISSKSKFFRTKEEIVRDLTKVLNDSELTMGTKRFLIHNATWVWTEYYGKYKGCPFWSKDAYDIYQSGERRGFRHEHVVPREYIIERLISLKEPNIESVKSFLETYLIGAIVTVNQEKELNRIKFDEKLDDVWFRYKKSKTEVLQIDWKKGSILKNVV